MLDVIIYSCGIFVGSISMIVKLFYFYRQNIIKIIVTGRDTIDN